MTSNEESARSDRLSATPHTIKDVCVVTLQGEIDHTTRDILEHALLGGNVAAGPLRIVADLEGVTFMDSSGLNVLISANRQVNEAGGRLSIAAAQEAVQRVLTLVGVDTVIDCHPTLEDALQS
ncbi:MULTISPECIES: STAS domain-containing protein [unclassified Streptomyces]|uniref:STAS domain-containing protein n=1 Tax=unclassified Streptomyces TaxID=2593676 RepID=UPI003626DC52